MDRLGLLKTLITALDEGSLSRAAKRQGVTQSAVSQQIRQLEHALGHKLLLRTSSGVHATRAGATAAQHARQVLKTYQALERDLETQSDHLSGSYRISVSTVLGRSVFGKLLLEMSQKFPALNISMGTEDRYVDVVREGYDLAIRAGEIGRGDGYGRKIAALETVLVATPDFLNKYGRPESVVDLTKLKFIRYNLEDTSAQLRVKEDDVWVEVPINVGFTASDPQLVIQALQAGVGFAKTVRFLVEEQLENGQLEQVLPFVGLEKKTIYAICPSPNSLDKCQQAIIDGFLKVVTQRNQRAKSSTLTDCQGKVTV